MMKVPAWMAAGAVCGLTAIASAETATEAQLRAKVDALEKRLSEVENKGQENWLNERRAEEVKALIQEVLADADTRASLMQDGMTAGWNKKFFLASADGTFLLNIGGRIQARYIYNYRETGVINLNDDADFTDSGESNNDDQEGGFSIRRMKPAFSGFIGGPKFEYNVVLAADRNTTAVGLEEARIGYAITDQIKIEGGRFKAPFLREELTSSGRQLTVERSYMNEAFTIGFTEGVMVTYANELFKIAAMFSDGRNQGEISNAANDFQNDTNDAAFTARVDVRLAGDWKQMEETSAWAGEQMGIFLGGAIHYEMAETGSATGANSNDTNLYWTFDASVEVNGLGIYAAVAGRSFDDEAATGDFDQLGVVVQISFFVIADKLEPFFRAEWLDTDGFSPFAVGSTAINAAYDQEVVMLTAGVNYYFRKHDAKFTLDVVFTPTDAVPVAQGGLGILQDDDDAEGQIVVRTQFQLQF